MIRPGRGWGPARTVRSTALTCVLAWVVAVVPAAEAGWSKPFQFAKPGTLDALAPQLAFSSDGGSAAAFGIEDVDVPGSSQAYLASRSTSGSVGAPLAVGGARQVLALSFDGRALELLTGASPAGQTCCSSAQAVQLSAGGRLGRARTLVGGLTGATLGRLLTLADGQMVATVATERGVWAVQSSRGNRFTAAHRLSGVRQEPESMASAWLGGERTIVAWIAGSGIVGATSARSIDIAMGSRTSAPGRSRVAVTVAAGHEIDELGVARRGSTATLGWIESWFDRRGGYHSEVRAADVTPKARISTLSAVNRLASGLSFGADGAGDQGVVWQSCTANAGCTVQSSVRSRSAPFAGVSNLGATDPTASPALTVGPRGQVLVGWVRGGRPTAALGSASRRRFGKPRALSTSTYAADLTVVYGPRSQALAAWTQGTLNPSVVGAAYR